MSNQDNRGSVLFADNFACAVGDDDVIDFGLVAVLAVELLLGLFHEVVLELVLHKVDGAAAEAATHDSRSGHAAALGHVVEEVEFFAAYLVVFGKTVVSFVHAAAYGFIVALVESVADSEDAVFFLDDEFSAEVVFGSDVGLHRVEHFHVGVAESLDAEALCNAFAGRTALVIGAVGEFVFYARVDQNEAVVFWSEGIVFEFHRTAVEAHEVVFLAHDGSELVHDAAVHAAVVVFCRLTDFGKFELVDLIVVEEVVERECEAGFEGSRRAEASAEGHIACENGVETFNLAAALEDFAANTEDVAGPRSFGSVGFIETEFCVIVDIDRIDAYFVSSVRTDFGCDYFVDGAGEYEAAVVVSMFADEIDASGRCVDAAMASETIFKGRVYFFLDVHWFLVFKY